MNRTETETQSAARIGRPMKYAYIIEMLEDDEIYSAGSIVRHAASKDAFPADLTPDERRLHHLRARIALGRFSRERGFTRDGDGWARVNGQPAAPGWYGWRWKAALPRERPARAADVGAEGSEDQR